VLKAFLADIAVRLRERPSRWIAYGMLVGAASGITAVLFFLGLEAASHFTFGLLAQNPLPSPPGDRLLTFEEPGGADPRRWVFFVLPMIGGLLSGLVVYRFAPETEGHGTDAVIKAFHQDRGMIRARVPLVKGIATIFTLASGGSAGKEGPIAQMGSGLASFMATKLGMSARDRRILLLTGMAGGLGAIFRAPLGSAITAIEVLYREDFESDAMIPCVISSVTAYVTFVLLLGSAQIFSVPDRPLIEPMELPGFLLLALIGVPVGRFYIGLFYGLRDRLFNRLPVPRYLLPMLGGLGVGLIGLGFPQAYGSGWGHIQKALDGELLIMTMAAVVIAKILATSMTIGSGGSGGVFGPTLFIGGMLGGAVGYGGHELLPAFFPHPGAYVLVGMAAFFAGVASAPIGAMLMVAEMTGGYTLLPPLMLVSVVAILLMRQKTIYENQVRDRFQSPAHLADLTVNLLEEMKVADVFKHREGIQTVLPESGFEAVRRLILSTPETTVPVVDAHGGLVGLVTTEQIRVVMDEREIDRVVLAEDICVPPVSVQSDDDLFRAHELFRISGCPQIPVVEATSEGGSVRIVGMLDYRDMMHAYERELAHRRES
jgi:CIC family chloride channel protein